MFTFRVWNTPTTLSCILWCWQEIWCYSDICFCEFPPTAFSIASLLCIVDIWTITHPGKGLFWSSPLGALSASCFWIPRLWEFLAVTSLNRFSMHLASASALFLPRRFLGLVSSPCLGILRCCGYTHCFPILLFQCSVLSAMSSIFNFSLLLGWVD